MDEAKDGNKTFWVSAISHNAAHACQARDAACEQIFDALLCQMLYLL